MPAILVYWGETIENNPLHIEEDAPEFWRKARSKFHETEQPRQHGEGHAFGFVHRRWMSNHVVPIVAGRTQHLLPAKPAATAPLL